MVVYETCMAAKAVRFGNAFNVAQNEIDEPVALALHSIHDRTAIDADNTIMVHTEARRRFDGVGRIRRGDEQLARHAADAGAQVVPYAPPSMSIAVAPAARAVRYAAKPAVPAPMMATSTCSTFISRPH
jgi:hypothetical protein